MNNKIFLSSKGTLATGIQPYVELRRTTITVTLRCTLKCKLCSADVINYPIPPHYTYEFIAKEVDRYFQLIDYVEWLQYSGGEPFMNKELPQMIEKAMEYSERFDKLILFSNGTILPTEEMIHVMVKYKDKISFILSHYGDISCKANELVKLWEDNKLSHKVKKYYGDDLYCNGWVDFGGWDKRNSSINRLCEVYDNCAIHDMRFTVVQNGEFHLCRMSFRGMELGAIPRNKNNYLDIFDEGITISQMKDKINQLMNINYIDACDYCNGLDNDSYRISPAEQL